MVAPGQATAGFGSLSASVGGFSGLAWPGMDKNRASWERWHYGTGREEDLATRDGWL